MSKSQPAAAAARLYLHRPADGTEPIVRRQYVENRRLTTAQRAALPDLLDAVDAVEGAAVPLQQVGISGFRIPLRYRGKRGGAVHTLETSVTGTVSLGASLKGINMSRIMRSFYEHRDEVFTLDRLQRILARYQREIGALHARLRLSLSYPILQRALRSGHSGYQYYAVRLEGVLAPDGRYRKFMELDFVYSSACPCSAELAEHARHVHGVYAIPHSQRSKARVRVEIDPRARWTIEDLQEHCLRALRTETQVMVRREDEQAFAEMNGAYLKFVEDAARLLYAQLQSDRRIVDFQVLCSHQESLHSHDAVSAIAKGVPGGMTADDMGFDMLR